MAFWQRPLLAELVVVSLLALAVGSQAYELGDVAMFWGLNKSEGTMREACDTGAYTTVLISFLRAFGHGKYSLDLSGHPIAGVGNDIKHCQSKGILVFLSIGGPAAAPGACADYSLPTLKSAADVAAYMWDAYLGGGRAGLHRPFGDAALDGVDFYIDNQSAAGDHYDELVRRLYAYNSHYHGRLGVTLTATVRCAYPELPSMAAALATGLFSRVHVRNYGSLNCTLFEREDTETWMAQYPSTRVLVGVSAEDKVGGQVEFKDFYYDVLQFVLDKPNYGGIMVWNRYFDKKNHFISNS